MLISIVNHTKGKLSDEQVLEGIRAVNRQIAHDFQPYWDFGGELRLEGTNRGQLDSEKLSELRGDAIIYLWDEVDVEDVLGYHDMNAAGVPFGFVSTRLVEGVEGAMDRHLLARGARVAGRFRGDLLVAGPHPADPGKEVFHWYKCVTRCRTRNTRWTAYGCRTSCFRCISHPVPKREAATIFWPALQKKTLRSFSINPGGYIGFYNPENREHETFALKADTRARQRLKIKSKAQLTRRSMRYTLGSSYPERIEHAIASTKRGRRAVTAARPLRRAVTPPRAVEMIDRSQKRPGLGVD